MSNEQWGGFAAGIVFGALVGGGIALLLAPKSGKETRELIRDKSGDVYEVVKRKIGDARLMAGEKISGGECFPPGSNP